MATLTVFTPAYNRAHTITRTYESMLRQDCKDFIWMVIDDGSTDNTAELVREWQKRDNGFEIIYIYKENGGMHTAHNTAYENITTELNTCIDSDDMLADGAVRIIVDTWNRCDRCKYAGIVGLDADFDKKVIGKDFPKDLKHTTLSGYYDAGGSGDKKLVYRTDIMQKLPSYPVFGNEKYVSLGWKYQLCDQEYELIPVNEILCYVEYQPDGSSNSMLKQYLNNPQGFAFIRKENLKYIKSFKRNLIDCVHYVSSSIIGKNKHFLSESPKKLMTVCAVPFGVALTCYIKIKVK